MRRDLWPGWRVESKTIIITPCRDGAQRAAPLHDRAESDRRSWAGHAGLLFQAGADFDVFGEGGEDGAAFGADAGGDDHAVGFDAAEFARGEVGDDDDFAVDQFFGLVELCDAGADLADLGADVYGELEQFVGADDALGGFDLADTHFDFGEIFDADALHAFGCGCCSRGASRCGCGCCRCGWRRRFLCFVLHGFHPLYGFRFVDAGEQRLRRAELRAGPELAPAETFEIYGAERRLLAE